ncbi:MAG: TlpA family protein disulfide reductase [Gammaproteobacteria bacterium]|nr:TlpA family protein disulfide reductase [Gammaproteobacteria bacterium]
MKKQLLFIGIAALSLIVGLQTRLFVSEASAEANSQTLPDISLPDTAGKQHNLKEWQGKILILNFWATWCPPCMKEMPEFQAIQNEFGDKGVQFVGVALDEAEPVQEFITKKNITYPILIGPDAGMKLAHDLGNVVNTVPFTVIFDKKGQLIKRQMGTLDREAILEIINPLFKGK